MKIRLLRDWEFASVTKDIVKEKLTKNISFPFRIFSQKEIKHPQNCFQLLLLTGAQQLEKNFSFLTYEISFVIFIIAFGVTGYSIRNNKVGEISGDIVFIIF